MSIWEIQQARKRAELEPHDWDAYRDALIASGMVIEAWQRRHKENFSFECDTPDDCPHYKQGAGMANTTTPKAALFNAAFGNVVIKDYVIDTH